MSHDVVVLSPATPVLVSPAPPPPAAQTTNEAATATVDAGPRPADAAPVASSGGVVAMLHPSLVSRYPGLAEHLESLACTHTIDTDTLAPVAGSVHWTRPYAVGEPAGEPSTSAGAPPSVQDFTPPPLPRLLVVIETTELVRLGSSGALVGTLERTMVAATAWVDGCSTTLAVVGRAVAGLEQWLAHAQLHVGVSARRVLNHKELAELIANHTTALSLGGRAAVGGGASMRTSLGGQSGEAFLAGLTAHDVLHNKGKPKSLRSSWVGALKQVLPEAAAVAVADEYPSFRKLYDRLRSQPDGGLGVADVRVGAKRLGPVRSKRLHRVLMAAREEAEDFV